MISNEVVMKVIGDLEPTENGGPLHPEEGGSRDRLSSVCI